MWARAGADARAGVEKRDEPSLQSDFSFDVHLSQGFDERFCPDSVWRPQLGKRSRLGIADLMVEDI
jgi:hypothetical protein